MIVAVPRFGLSAMFGRESRRTESHGRANVAGHSRVRSNRKTPHFFFQQDSNQRVRNFRLTPRDPDGSRGASRPVTFSMSQRTLGRPRCSPKRLSARTVRLNDVAKRKTDIDFSAILAAGSAAGNVPGCQAVLAVGVHRQASDGGLER